MSPPTVSGEAVAVVAMATVPVNDGEAEKTTEPVPVSFEMVEASCALVVDAN